MSRGERGIDVSARGVFITGTDTGVGKSIVATALVRSLVRRGLRAAGMKPIASGSERTADGLRNADALDLIAAANVGAPYETVNPYCFEQPISPHIAAKEAAIRVDLGKIKGYFETLAARADFVVVEGAGGWFAPIQEAAVVTTMADLALTLGKPVLLVVGMRLGCLNHALLTRCAIDSVGACWAGWVANDIDPAMERRADNLASLERLLGEPPLARVPFLPGLRAAEAGFVAPDLLSEAAARLLSRTS